MKKETVILLVACLVMGALFGALPRQLRAEQVFVTIGGGDFSGVYFPTGRAIAKMINHRRSQYGIRAAVESTSGSTFNLNALAAGYMDFGMTQADKQHHAFNGLYEWAAKGPQKDLRSVFSIYHETLTLVAAVDAGIETLADLKGKRVSLGNPGSSRHRMVLETIEAAGLDPRQDIVPMTVIASEAPNLLQDNILDAYFFTVGHPNETVRKALSGGRQARLVPISGPGIDRLVDEKQFYTKMPIRVERLYPGVAGPTESEVATFGVMATLCTSARVSEQVVYTLTKVVFDNRGEFRRQHPALAGFDLDRSLHGLSAPLHSGALKYFREVGLLK